MNDTRRTPRLGQIVAGVAGLAIGASAVALAAPGQSAPQPNLDRTAMEQMIRDYILGHPEIIPEAMTRLQERESAKLVATSRAAIEKPFASAWAGAQNADVTLVEFYDYACTYCKASVPDIERLLREDKSLRVVFRELPILSDQSDVAARVSLSAAKQGRFMDFHRRMFATGRPTEAEIAAARTATRLDAAAVARDMKAADVQQEIDANLALARTLSLTGTPSFIVGDRILSGAVGYDALKKAVAEARAAKG
ncbi:MAG: DsbA oxidoreductase [Sphingomonas bacterium]|nr:DsbA family protein [Sphingomonas bacterium]MDB5689108.1 DsbA oxidoreductase [Sphingomonas bacterium]